MSRSDSSRRADLRGAIRSGERLGGSTSIVPSKADGSGQEPVCQGRDVDLLWQRLVLCPDTVEVCFSVPEEGDSLLYTLRCRTCEEEFSWVPGKQLFECPTCGFELRLEVEQILLQAVYEKIGLFLAKRGVVCRKASGRRFWARLRTWISSLWSRSGKGGKSKNRSNLG